MVLKMLCFSPGFDYFSDNDDNFVKRGIPPLTMVKDQKSRPRDNSLVSRKTPKTKATPTEPSPILKFKELISTTSVAILYPPRVAGDDIRA